MCVNDSFFTVPKNATLPYHWQYASDHLAIAVAFASTFGSLFIIISFLVRQDLRRTTSRRILVFISIADLGSCSSQAVGAFDYFGVRPPCEIQAAFTVFFSLAFILWTTCLAIYLYMSLVRDSVVAAKHMVNCWFHAIGWGIPLACSLLSYFMDSLGSDQSYATNGWCWVSVEVQLEPDHWECRYAILLWAMVSIKGWELLSYVIVPVLYIKIKRHIKRVLQGNVDHIVSDNYRRAVTNIDRKLILFPVAYVLLRMWGTIRVFLFLFHYYDNKDARGQPEFKAFEYLQALGDNGQGAVNFILFVVMTNKMRRLVHCCCGCFYRHLRSDAEGLYDDYHDVRHSTLSNDTIEMSDSTQIASRMPGGTPGHVQSYATGEAASAGKQRKVRKWLREAKKRIGAEPPSRLESSQLLESSATISEYGTG